MLQAVIAHLRLHNEGFGSLDEREALLDFQGQLATAIQKAGVGEFDGDMFGEGECILYMYGPDADRLFAEIEPLLRTCPLASGGYAVKRYGEAGGPVAREVRVGW